MKKVLLALLAFFLMCSSSARANTVDLLNLNQTVSSYLEQGSHFQLYNAAGPTSNCGPSQYLLCDSWSCPPFNLEKSQYDSNYNQTYYCSYQQDYYMALMPSSLCQNASVGDYLYYRANFYVNASDNANPDIETIVGNFGPGGWKSYFDWNLNLNVYPQHIYNPIDYNYNVDGNYISIDVLASVEDNTYGSSSNRTGCAISMTSRSAPIFTLRNYSLTTDYDLKVTSTFTPIALIPQAALSSGSGSGGGGSSINLQTIEDYLDSIDTNTAYTNTLLNTLLTDLTNINTSIQSGNSNTTSLINDLSSIISALSTLANNQGTITQNQVTQDTNIATYISGQTSTIQSLLNQIIANQGSSTVNVDMTTTNNLLSDIQSSLNQIESYASSNATNIYGIAQNANTQTQYQYDIAQNTDYIPLIYNFLSGGTSTPDYSFTLNTIDQNAQISAANSTFFKQQYESNNTSVTNTFSSFANSVINQGYQTGSHTDNEQHLKSGIPNLLQRPWTLQSVDCEKLDPSLTSYSIQTRYTCYHDGTFNKCLQVDFCIRRHLANIFNGGDSDDAYTDTSQTYSCDFFLTGLNGGPSMNCGTNFLAMIDTIAKTMIYFYIITDIYKTIINIANVTHDDKLDILEI